MEKDEAQMSVEGKTQMVDVGGYHLLLRTQGTGWPTVILDAGLGNTTTSAEWAPICADVAEFTQCCSYDRVGLGGSDPTDGERTSLQAVDDLHRLMHHTPLGQTVVE